MKRNLNHRVLSNGLSMFLLFLGLHLMADHCFGRALKENEVRSAVETWVRHVAADARIDAVVERLEPHISDLGTVGYVAHLNDGGYCLCGSDDRVFPVYFYSPRGTFNPEDPGMIYYLCYIETRFSFLSDTLRKSDGFSEKWSQELAKRASLWQDLINGVVPQKANEVTDDASGNKNPDVYPASMELGLTCAWRQDWPYNYYCPGILGPDGGTWHAVVGCVATGLSQIMHYWQWPPSGEGVGSVTYDYRWKPYNTWIVENLDFNPFNPNPPLWPLEHRLKWQDVSGGRLVMSGYWDNSIYYHAERMTDDIPIIAQKVAYLQALQTLWNGMNTGSIPCDVNFGTTTYRWDLIEDVHTDPFDAGDEAVATLCHHVGVALNMDYGVLGSGAVPPAIEPALENHFKYDPDAIDELKNLNTMVEDIQWLRPIRMGGYGEGCGGHDWVVFGYNANYNPYQFLMNLGGGPSSVGWGILDTICPDGQGHVTHIAPRTGVKFVGAAVAGGDGSPADPYQNIEAAVSGVANGTTLIFKAGSDNTFSPASLLITKALVLKGKDAVIRKE